MDVILSSELIKGMENMKRRCPKCTAIMEEGLLLNMEYIKTKRFKRLKKLYLKEDDKLQKKCEKKSKKSKVNNV